MIKRAERATAENAHRPEKSASGTNRPGHNQPAGGPPEARTEGHDREKTAAGPGLHTGCEIWARQLAKPKEMLWELLARAADQTCTDCDVQTLKDACQACPALELLRRLGRLAEMHDVYFRAQGDSKPQVIE